jgi:hypothetical protein
MAAMSSNVLSCIDRDRTIRSRGFVSSLSARIQDAITVLKKFHEAEPRLE